MTHLRALPSAPARRPWPYAHLSEELREELERRLARHKLEALSSLFLEELPADMGWAFAVASATRAAVKLELQAMLDERLEHLRLALDTGRDFLTPEGPLQTSPFTVGLLTLPAEVTLLRAALSSTT